MKNIYNMRGRAALAACTAGILGAAFASSVKAQNLLPDPSFEANVDGSPDASAGDVPMVAGGPWLGWNNWLGPYSGYYSSDLNNGLVAHSGDQVAKTFSGPNGGVYQFIPVNAGDSYTASAWFINSSTANGGADVLNGPETDDVRMIFFSGAGGTGNNLGTFVTPTPVSDLTPENTWTQLSVTTNAPAGAESVQWMAFFNNPNGSGGALFVDDASLVDNTVANPIWNGSGADNNWSTSGNWGGTSPTSPSSPLVFDGNARTTNNNDLAAGTVFSGIQFNATAGAFVLGGNAVGLNGDVVNNSTNTQTINLGLDLQANTNINAASGNIAIAGAISGSASVTVLGGNVVTLSGANTYSGGTTVSAGKLVIGAAGALPANSDVSITGGELQLGTSTGLETLSGLTIGTGGTLDINNNHILLSYGAGTQAATDAAVRAELITGRNGGAWNGPGIDSSAAASNSGYALGYADGADGAVIGLASGQIEIKYTLVGDANLDGVVNGDDFTILAGNLGKTVTGWDKGDFLYTGSVTGDDFTALVSNLGKAANGTSVALPASDYAAIDAFAAANGLTAEVPEPASVGLIVLACVGSLSRRNRRPQ